VVDLTGQTIPASGFFLAAQPGRTLPGTPDMLANLNFENSDNVTHLLVAGFTGRLNLDLDDNNDCTLDVTPWAIELDRIALVEEGNPPVDTECHYGPPQIGPDLTFVPAQIFRCPDGTGAWQIGVFNPLGDTDTPGAPNGCVAGNAKAVKALAGGDRTEREAVTREPVVTAISEPGPNHPDSPLHAPLRSRLGLAGLPTITLIPVGGVGNEITATPGQSITIEAFISPGVTIRGYEVALPAQVTNGSGGTVDAVEGSAVVDTERGDYVFNGPVSYPAGGVDDNARVASAVHDEDALIVLGVSYLGEFVFTVSLGAAGDFVIEPLRGPGLTNLADALSAPVDPFDAPEMVVHVTCVLNEQCDDGQFCNGGELCDGGLCASAGTNPCSGLPCDESDDSCCLAGDTNCDGCVNLFDYSFFQSCVTGPGGTLEGGCEPHDSEGDTDVDLVDFGAFMTRFSSGCP
ncbi:MAG: hypothetical protein V3W34_17175, partial [Phycisphaerae bacterium]